MRRSRPSAVRLILLAVAAPGWLALASPAATASPSPTSGQTGGALSITQVGAVDDGSYPTVGVTLSIVDAVSGRPETALDTGNVSPDPTAKTTSVTPGFSDLPAAYVVAFDNSKSMYEGPNYITVARQLAKALVQSLGPNDLVKIVWFGGTNASPTPTTTAWLGKDDATLNSKIDAINYENYGTPLSAWLVLASNIANSVPETITRRALVFITDADEADTDAALSPTALKTKLGPPTFLVGLQPASKVGAKMTQNLNDVATYTGGSYQTATADTDTTALFKPVLDSTRSTWTIKFSTDALPDGNSHQQMLRITDAQQRSGTATLSYRSGGLFVVSPLRVEGLAGGNDVTEDRTVTVTVTGTRTWKDARIDLFLDCDPVHCNPTQTADNGPLVWKLSVATLTRGSHRIVLRLTTTDDQVKYFSDTAELGFTVSGTTWNVAEVILVGGIALLMTGAFFIASRRKVAPRRVRS